MTVTASLLLGAFVGAINAVAAAWTARIAMAGEPGKALHLVLGGMVVAWRGRAAVPPRRATPEP